MFAKVENGVVTEWPLAEYIIQAIHPRTSFPSPISDEALIQFGFARFVQVSPATYDADFQEAKEITPVLNGAVATQAWEIVEKYTAEEKAAKLAEKTAREAELAATEYQRQRAAEYPPIGDQLDALWKGGDAAADMLAKVQAVKAKYPKP
jgi:hypothetical protein